jgi:biotin synthase
LTSQKTEYISRAAKAIKEQFDFHLIACCGSADKESLRELKDAGVDSYNHNLETSREFFPKVCTTHTWDERYETCQNAASVGLMLCVGGIRGVGESFEDREEFYKAVSSLKPFTSPVNFYIPNPALPIKNAVLDRNEALECIKLAKRYLPETRLMMAGGREVVFGLEQKEIFSRKFVLLIHGTRDTRHVKMPQAWGLCSVSAASWEWARVLKIEKSFIKR